MDPLETRRSRPAESNLVKPLRETASQTAGPYVHIGCLPESQGINGVYPNDLKSNQKALSSAETVMISGKVFDGEGSVCKDILLEFWHPDEDGDNLKGFWSRIGVDPENGRYELQTELPSSLEDDQGNPLAPFIYVWIVARGINIGLLTRIYFSQLGSINESDPHLKLVPEGRVETLMARQEEDGFRFDIHLQGEHETVFFDT